MTKEEIMDVALYAMSSGMGTIMLQSGEEVPTPQRVNSMVKIIKEIREKTVGMDVKRRYGRDSITQEDLEKKRQLGEVVVAVVVAVVVIVVAVMRLVIAMVVMLVVRLAIVSH